jgi:UDP-N-acetylmuramyl pentapeptide phosphotransferase/UDP-N-acetylglucosamine-1-phosphate transferase
MNTLNVLQGVFQSPALIAAGWGFVSAFMFCVVLVITKRWHGALTMDCAEEVQKFHTAPTPRVGGVPIVLGLVVVWGKAPPEVQDLLTPILFAGLPAFIFGVAEDITKRVGVMQRHHHHVGRWPVVHKKSIHAFFY